MSKFIVMTASARVAGGFGTYRRVAVVELEEGFDGAPKMISERAKGVKEIVKDYGKLNVGKTERCAYQVALADARELADDLSGGAR